MFLEQGTYQDLDRVRTGFNWSWSVRNLCIMEEINRIDGLFGKPSSLNGLFVVKPRGLSL